MCLNEVHRMWFGDFRKRSIHEGRKMCEDCFIDVSRFPLGHTGLYRDKIGGDRRRLNIVRD